MGSRSSSLRVGFLGERLVMLLGSWGEPETTESTSPSELVSVPTNDLGSEIMRMASAPMEPIAISLPR